MCYGDVNAHSSAEDVARKKRFRAWLDSIDDVNALRAFCLDYMEANHHCSEAVLRLRFREVAK